MRNININGQKWQYQVGNKFVKFVSPNRKSSVVELPAVKGLSMRKINVGRNYPRCDVCNEHHCEDHGFEHFTDSGVEDGMIRPSEIKAYIQNHLLNQ